MKVNSILDVMPRQTAKADTTANVEEGGFSEAMDKATESQKSDTVAGKDSSDTTANSKGGEDGEAIKDIAGKIPEAEAEQTLEESAAAMSGVAVVATIQNTETVVQTDGEIIEAVQETAVQEQGFALVQEEASSEQEKSPKVTVQAEAEQPKEAKQAGTSEAESFAKQVLQEAKNMLESNKVQEAQTTAAAAEEKAVADTAAEEPAMNNSEDDSAEAEEKTADAKLPVTATITDEGKVEFKLNAPQPLETQTAKVKDTQETFISRLIDQVKATVTSEKTEFYLQLKPEHLGGLSIMLSAEEKGVVAKLMTANQNVQNMIQSDMQQLLNALRDKGINVVEIEVIYNQMADSTAGNRRGNEQQQFSGHAGTHGRVTESMDGALAMYDNLSYYDVLAEQGGSVEFSA